MDYRTRIRNVREDRDFTQAQIAQVLHKSQQGYSHIESGRAELKIDGYSSAVKKSGKAGKNMVN